MWVCNFCRWYVISFLHLVYDSFNDWIYLFLLKATKTYENDDLKVTVVTKEINPEEESSPTERKEAAPALSPHPVVADKKKLKSVPINNKKPFKKVAKHKSRPKQICKRDKRKGKKPGRKWWYLGILHLLNITKSAMNSIICGSTYWVQ